MDQHQTALKTLCRVCGQLLCKGKSTSRTGYLCKDSSTSLQTIFSIDIREDIPSVHPDRHCHSCRNIIYFTRQAAKEDKEYIPNMPKPVHWEAHTEPNCGVCNMPKPKRGRPRKSTNSGIPKCIPQHMAIKHVKDIAPISRGDSTLPTTIDVNLTCPICMEVVDQPIELTTCSTLVCAKCLCDWLRNSFSCPCCYSPHMTDFSTIRPATVVQRVLTALQHSSSPPQQESVQEILDRPVSSPLTPLEEQLQTALVRRSLKGSGSTVRVKTGGQPLTLVQVRQPRVPTAKASASSVRRRSHEIDGVRKRASGEDESAQLTDEILSRPRKEKQVLVKSLMGESNFRVEVPASVSLALKADLQIPWSKLRDMRRWLGRESGIQLASESKMRQEAAKLLGSSAENLVTLYAPFSFPAKDGNGEEIRNAPISYVPDLWSKIKEMLDANDNIQTGVHRLTWHEGMPKDEVWVKLGGDKGGGTFKAGFQLCNVPKPNSPENTCLFCVFEAPDSYVNLHIALDRYRVQVDQVQAHTWRGKKVKVFLCGDYEFLTRMFGLSGASGRHCCLWCLARSDQLKNPPSSFTPRTTDTIISDHHRFVAAGANLKRAKEFNNTIDEPFFRELPIDQVCPPALHITLGIFQRLFNLLENKCHLLDLRVTCEDSADHGGATYSRYVVALQRQAEVMEELQKVRERKTNQAQLATLMVLMTDEEEDASDPRMTSIFSELQLLTAEEKKMDEELKSLDKVVGKDFHKEDGPFVKALHGALDEFNVHTQAYHSRSFVGNHVHRTLKETNREALCNAVKRTGQRFSTTVGAKAEEVCQTFTQAFALFEGCHRIYDKGNVSDEDISILSQNIKSFMAFYRATFPEATVTPKMHMMEYHLVPWLAKWKVGLGLMGEQGAESIHKKMNSLGHTYSTIPDGVPRLECMMKEHYLHIAPQNISLRPPIKKRKVDEQ